MCIQCKDFCLVVFFYLKLYFFNFEMSKEEFMEILSRQQCSSLTIKDFYSNEEYTESNFHYWKGKFRLSRPYHANRLFSSLEEFTQSASPPHQQPYTVYDGTAMGSSKIRIEFPGGIIAHFSGMYHFTSCQFRIKKN